MIFSFIIILKKKTDVFFTKLIKINHIKFIVKIPLGKHNIFSILIVIHFQPVNIPLQNVLIIHVEKFIIRRIEFVIIL